MRARIVVTLTAEIDSPIYPADDTGAAAANISALINHHLAVGSISELSDILFEDTQPGGNRGREEWAAARRKAKRAEADLAKLLVQDMKIQVSRIIDSK